MHFEIGDKTGRIYRILLRTLKGIDNKSIDEHKREIKKAFDNIAIKNGGDTKEKYQATLAATNRCLNNITNSAITNY